jgi:hypothetical protein
MEQRDQAIAAQWRRRIERARYDMDLAERRYEAVDPHNRLIAATLEQRWNDAMQKLRDLETEFADFEMQTLRAITAEQKLASATGSSTTGSNGVSFPLCNVNQMRPTRSKSMTNWIDISKNGSPTPPTFTHHPQRNQHEVQYAVHVAIASGRCPPGFGMYRRRDGSARYAPRWTLECRSTSFRSRSAS